MTHQEAYALAKQLVAQMTLEEKASQLKYDAPAIDRLGIPAYNWWNEALHGVARAGTATVFPQAIGMAAAFDEDLMTREGELIATEARAKYNAARAHGDRDIYKGLTFWSPNVNIFRDPRWGRGQETYGEDPTLTSRLAVRFIKAMQGDGKHLKVAACAKHLAVHSGPEATRHQFDARVNDKDLYETYLPAFKAAVEEADVEAVMGAYNRVNGEPACGSKRLLTGILRGQWGFEGHVVSDCWAVSDFHQFHHVTDTAPQSAALAIKMGCDINCGNTYLHLLQALKDGLITEDDITRACVRAMATRYRLGTLDGGSEYDSIPISLCDTDEGNALALRAAQSSMVLLKNDGVLPLQRSTVRRIAVIGPNADSRAALLGNYNGTPSRAVTFLEGIRHACEHGPRVTYSEGCPLWRDRTSNLAGADDRLSEAAALAEDSDVVIVCVGLDASIEGEAGDVGNEFSSGDKETLELPAAQRRLLDTLEKTGKPLVVVCASGSALALRTGNAILQAWYPGQAGGTALANLIFGEVSPSGRLPVTFYESVDDLPDFNDYALKGRTYRYFEGKPLYPFGHGLSYARFVYANARIEGSALVCDITNDSDIEADEVTLAYVKADSPFSPPNPSLFAFARTHFEPRSSKTVTLPIPERALDVVDDQGERTRAGGIYAFTVGGLSVSAAL